jgi:site-specific DNA-adenine methylase
MKLGIPYMGSKRKIAKNVLDKCLELAPDTKYFYDLFGGGGAISFEALQRDQIQKVFYNDFNPQITTLMQDLKDNAIHKRIYKKWISREEFNDRRYENSSEGAIIGTCWSFGNNPKKGYLYSKALTPHKKLLHEIVVKKCEESLLKFNKEFNINIPKSVLDIEPMNDRRLRIMREIKQLAKSRLGELRHLESLNRLQHLERLNRVKEISIFPTITNLSYQDVKINTSSNETLIYLDPPYTNTTKYTDTVCHNELLNWIQKSNYKIVVSSYEFDSLKEVYSKDVKTSMSSTNALKRQEKLFTNF